MNDINFTMTKKNFKLLIEHVFIGNWIINGTKIERDETTDDLLNTILSIGKNYNIMGEIEYDQEHHEYDLPNDKVEEIMDKIQEYEDDTFWEDLVDKLATRDAIEKNGIKKMEELEHYERMKKIWDEEQKYVKEFEKNGIENLRISK